MDVIGGIAIAAAGVCGVIVLVKWAINKYSPRS